MAAKKKAPAAAKRSSGATKKRTSAKKPAVKGDVDRRWSILLFGLGLLFFILAVVPGENGWAWVRQNIYFGTFGISGWLFGPMMIYWAVLIGLEKPLFPAVIKGSLFLLALCGVALVFGKVEFTNLTFGEVLAALHASGSKGAFGGGMLSLLFGASLQALAGKVVARILLALLFVVALMVFTGVTPGDIARFFGRLGDRLTERFDREENEDFYEETDDVQQLPLEEVPAAQRASRVPPAAKTNERMSRVDIPLEPRPQLRPADTVQRTNTRMMQVDIPLDPVPRVKPRAEMFRDKRLDIDLGPQGPVSETGPGQSAPVQIGPGGTFGDEALNHAPATPKLPKENAYASNVAAEENSEFGLGDYTPLVPFDRPTQKIAAMQPQPETAPGGDMLLFGEHDPYANLGGADSKLPPGSMLDVEYIPQPDMEFDLFGNPASRMRGTSQPQRTNESQPMKENLFAQTQAMPFGNEVPRQELPPLVAAAKNAAEDAFDQPTSILPQEGGTALQQDDVQAAEAVSSVQPVSPKDMHSAHVDALIEKAAQIKDTQAEEDTRGREHFVEPYQYPPVELFDVPPRENTAGVREEMKKTADLLVSTLDSFGVQTRILDVSRGPSVTRYEIQPQAGVKISRITNLSDDIALNLAAAGVRIEAPIPGKPAVGIEVPNKVKSMVPIRGLLESSAFADATSPLSFALGKDIAGDVVVADLAKMPHLLIAGSTGSGKSVCVNSIIMSFLFKSSPEEVRMILIDPKVVELAEYNGTPHLLIPVVTEPKKAAQALGQAVKMMEDRYRLFAQYSVRDIKSYNDFARKTGQVETIPHIAIIIDELADLMMVAGKDVENYICRIAQKARAAGMHLIVATQRPSVDVITGLIKANIPSRIAFAVSSQVDSRTILDGAGAEKLLGMGDMLFMPIGANKPVRVQGTFVKDKEITRVLKYVKQHAGARYDEEVLAEMDKIVLSGSSSVTSEFVDVEDESAGLFNDQTFINAVEMALDAGEISTSGLQRRLRLGYARAGRIVDQMERLGIVSEPNGSKPRQTLITRQDWQEMVMNASE